MQHAHIRRGRHRSAATVAAIVVAAAGVIAASGCGGATVSPSGTSSTTTGAASAALHGEITVSAAASLTGAFTTIRDEFVAEHPGTTVDLNFGSSGQLAAQIAEGAPADVAAFADTTPMDGLARTGLLAGDATTFATNQLVLVTEPDGAGGIRGLADLPSAGTIALCVETAPCGKFAEELLSTAGVTVAETSVTRGPDVKATLAAVAEGDAAAGIVYRTDARAAGGAVTTIELPEAEAVVARYPVAVLAATAHRDVADAFVAWVTGRRGRAVLDEAGFGTP